MTLLERIKAVQESRGWNDSEFSHRLGMSQSTWSRIKGGSRPLDNVRFLRSVANCMPELRWHIAEYITGGNKE